MLAVVICNLELQEGPSDHLRKVHGVRDAQIHLGWLHVDVARHPGVYRFAGEELESGRFGQIRRRDVVVKWAPWLRRSEQAWHVGVGAISIEAGAGRLR